MARSASPTRARQVSAARSSAAAPRDRGRSPDRPRSRWPRRARGSLRSARTRAAAPAGRSAAGLDHEDLAVDLGRLDGVAERVLVERGDFLEEGDLAGRLAGGLGRVLQQLDQRPRAATLAAADAVTHLVRREEQPRQLVERVEVARVGDPRRAQVLEGLVGAGQRVFGHVGGAHVGRGAPGGLARLGGLVEPEGHARLVVTARCVQAVEGDLGRQGGAARAPGPRRARRSPSSPTPPPSRSSSRGDAGPSPAAPGSARRRGTRARVGGGARVSPRGELAGELVEHPRVHRRVGRRARGGRVVQELDRLARVVEAIARDPRGLEQQAHAARPIVLAAGLLGEHVAELVPRARRASRRL